MGLKKVFGAVVRDYIGFDIDSKGATGVSVQPGVRASFFLWNRSSSV